MLIKGLGGQDRPTEILKYLLGNYFNMKSISAFQEYIKKRHSVKIKVDDIAGDTTYSWLYHELLQPETFVSKRTGMPFTKFFSAKFPKKQIVLHHGANSDNSRNMAEGFEVQNNFVATNGGITDDGHYLKIFDEKGWAHHIGMDNAQNLQRNRESVSVEICAWGCLMERGGKFYAWPNEYGRKGKAVEVSKEKVVECEYKGWKYYERYTDKEIETTKRWILLNAMYWDIPLDYSDKDLWKVSQKAINGAPGIYTHNSYISWKSDIFPQEEIVAMLKDISKIGKVVEKKD